MIATIVSLHCYPIKSCAGIDLPRAPVTEAGLSHDRQWMLVGQDGRFMTQRQWPRMALIRPALREDALWVQAPGMPECRIGPLADPAGGQAPSVPLTVWNDSVAGGDAGDDAARWFTEFLGWPCRLYRVHAGARRLASPERVQAWRSRHGADAPGLGAEHVFGFADGFPILVASQDSLDDLNERLAARGEPPVPMDRFRPNVVIQGLAAYDEDHVPWLRRDDIVLALVKPCARCSVPDVDQASAARGVEPGRTLTAYRSREEGVMFGQNAVVQAPPGSTLAVGEALQAELDF